MKIPDGELRTLLNRDTKLTADEVRELVADSRQTGTSLLTTTLHSKLITEKQIARAYAKKLGLPFIDLEEVPIPTKTLTRLPLTLAKKHHVVVFDETPASIKLAMADPRNELAYKAIKSYAGKAVRRYLATGSGLTKAMRAYRSADSSPGPITTREVVATILEQAMRSHGQIIIFEPHGDELLIRIRHGKQLKTISTLPAGRLAALLSWCKLAAGLRVGDRTEPGNGRFSMKIAGEPHDILVNTLPTVSGETLSLRVLPPASSLPTLRELGLTASETHEFATALSDGRGLILLAGSSAAELGQLASRLTQQAAGQTHTLVASIEDPLVYKLDSVQQVEVTGDVSLDEAVASVLTSSPNVVATPSLPNAAGFESLVDYALSGHLIMARTYGLQSTTVIKRLFARPLAPALTAAALRLVVMQHVIPKLCNRCRVEIKPAGPLAAALKKQFELDELKQFYRMGPGCEMCDDGVSGQVFAYEMIRITRGFQQLLATSGDDHDIQKFIDEHNGLRSRLGKLITSGAIAVDDASKLLA